MEDAAKEKLIGWLTGVKVPMPLHILVSLVIGIGSSTITHLNSPEVAEARSIHHLEKALIELKEEVVQLKKDQLMLERQNNKMFLEISRGLARLEGKENK